MTVLSEGVGDLATAIIEKPKERAYAEAVWVAAVALRIAEEGDPALDGVKEWHINQERPSCPST